MQKVMMRIGALTSLTRLSFVVKSANPADENALRQLMQCTGGFRRRVDCRTAPDSEPVEAFHRQSCEAWREYAANLIQVPARSIFSVIFVIGLRIAGSI
ncbi:hypothetical protein [Sphingopyxis sp.]|uniref:hypothetical protein n=1 Tax=Sphingopyxis sp. TaxID=1908224 RepID=UPI0025DF0E0A|nr:hypothetical protein [Sphingopyxis sp.]MBK6413839.1 hypothetical protein [Sphingopyxis sp.]